MTPEAQNPSKICGNSWCVVLETTRGKTPAHEQESKTQAKAVRPECTYLGRRYRGDGSDRGRSNPAPSLKGSRAVLAVLVGIIIFFGIVPNGRLALAANKDDETKISIVSFAKDIFVCNDSPCVEAFRSVVNFTEFAYGKMPSQYPGMETLLSRPNGRFAGERRTKIIYDRIAESPRDGGIGNIDHRKNSDAIGWGKPIISNDWPEFKLSMSSLALTKIHAGLYREISPQFHRRCLAQVLELSFAGLPQFVGSEPKSDRRDSEYDGKATDDAFVVSLKESIKRVKAGDYDRVKGGAIFIVIVAGGLLAVLWLYQAQR